jgi:hypothetical protein
MKVNVSILALAACTVLLAIPLTAADKPSAKAGKVMAALAVGKTWAPEVLSGKITMVDAVRKLVVVETPSGIPFDMVVTARTHIKSGDHAMTIKDLTTNINKTVSVKFTPERLGDVASSIQIKG